MFLWDRNKDGNYRGWQFSRYVTQISRLKLKMVTTGKLQRKLREFHANKVGNVRRLKGQQSDPNRTDVNVSINITNGRRF